MAPFAAVEKLRYRVQIVKMIGIMIDSPATIAYVSISVIAIGAKAGR